MVKWSLFISLSVLLCACSESDKKVPNNESDADVVPSLVQYGAYNFDTLVGTYVGKFDDTYLDLTLTYVTEFNAVGYGIVNGLVRNVSGKVNQDETNILLTLEEPGDHAHDGKFDLKIDKKTFEVQGKWTAFDAAIGSKVFVLKKKKDFVQSNQDFDYEDKVTEDNFLYFFTYADDSIGDFNFFEDGLVVYKYTIPEKENTGDAAAMEQALGSWKYSKGVVTIKWLPNFAFPSLKSTFHVKDDRSKDDGYLQLSGEGRNLIAGYQKY